MDSIDYTLGGTIDKANGPIVKTFSYVLRVPEDDPDDPDYGKMSELKTFFEYSNPAIDPTDILVLTDHYGIEHYVYYTGEQSPEPLTTMLEGSNAWHIVNATFLEALGMEVPGSGS
jgi:hypothetical protein